MSELEFDENWSDEDEIDRLKAQLAALVAALPTCFECGKPATQVFFSLHSCDAHVSSHGGAHAQEYTDLPYAALLRDLRVK